MRCRIGVSTCGINYVFINKWITMEENRHLDQFKSRVSLFLDNEMNTDNEVELLKELKANAIYRRVFDEECSFKNKIKEHIPRKTTSSDLINSIKEKINIGPRGF